MNKDIETINRNKKSLIRVDDLIIVKFKKSIKTINFSRNGRIKVRGR